MIDCFDAEIMERVGAAPRLLLFLDYDGTLADFAPTPDHVLPDPELVDLLQRLVDLPHIRVAIISGRRLAHIQRLVPVAGILLAGTYGVELQLPDGASHHRLSYDEVRPPLAQVKASWSELLQGRKGFYLEDKGWAVAIHAKDADPAEGRTVIARGRQEAEAALLRATAGVYRILGGDRFLEIGPALAHKGKTIAYLLEQWPWPGALPIYLGDDDKDEEAFMAIRAAGGVPLVVAASPRPSAAACRLPSPQAARQWLAQFLATT